MSRFSAAMMAHSPPPTPAPNDNTAASGHQLIRQTEEMQDGILPIEFTDDDLRKGILRGTPVPEIVAGVGKHWEAHSLLSEQSRSWALSQPVRRNTAFISHSWKASRFWKWLTLLAFFNGRSAAVAFVVTAMVAVFVDEHVGGERFHVHIKDVSMPDGRELEIIWTILPFFAGSIAGACVLFAGHHVRRVFEVAQIVTPQTVFLDKLVIHQDDVELQQRGIRLLGGFIRTSDVFLVLWSKEYLSRLWCSYEVAVFAHLKQTADFQGRLCIMPFALTKIIVGKVMKNLLAATLKYFLLTSSLSVTVAMTLYTLAYVIPMTVVTAAMIEFIHEADALHRQVKTYDLCEAECFHPPDRESVESAVTAWFQPKSRDVAIQRFNAFVRDELGATIGQVFGDQGSLIYVTALLAALPMFVSDTLGCVGNNLGLGPLNYGMWMLGGIVYDVPATMLTMAWQLRVVNFIERCCVPKQDGASLQESGTTDAPSSELSRKPLCVHVVACWMTQAPVNMSLLILKGAGAKGSLPPLPLVLSFYACVVLLSIYTYR